MFPKLLLTLSICICSLSNLFAQQANINGKIKSDSGAPLAGATVFLYTSKDSLLIKIAIADKTGNYEVDNITATEYFITVSFMGYIKSSTPAFTVSKGEKYVANKTLILSEGKQMQDIEITATREKPVIEVTAGKTILNVENNINAIGSNAFELLLKSPGITSDKDDNITMKGKNGVRIYIDGRPTQMDQSDLAPYLKSINSADITSIEMISNPSAKYDAAGNAGVINIKLKKNAEMGLNAAITTGLNIGAHLKSTDGVSLNYRNKAINIFSNYSYNWARTDNTGTLYRIQNDSLYNQTNFGNITGNVQNVKAGVDVTASKRSTFGFIYTGNFSDNTTFSCSTTPSSALNSKTVNEILFATNTLPAQIKNQNFNVNYRYADAAAHEVTIDIDHGFYNRQKTSFQPNSYYKSYPDSLISEKDYRNNTPTNIAINTQKIDYNTPFKKGKLSLGVKISRVKTDNNFNLYNVSGNQNTLDLNSSNTFVYNENITAAYTSYYTALSKKLNLQAGLRVENTASKSLLTNLGTAQTHGGDASSNNYTDFFPTASVNYLFNKANSIDLNFNRRIDRPNYSDLNPFETRVDELTYIKGNAYLRPQYTNVLQLTHTYKERYVTALSYSHISDFSAYITDTAKTTQTYISKKNLASQDVASLNIYIPTTITKWWTLSTSINIYNSRYHANFGVEKIININVTSVSLNAGNTLKLGNGFTGEIMAFYNSPYVASGTFKTNGLGAVDIGIQKKILNNNATIKISCTDVLHTLKWKGESKYGGADITATSRWESRQLKLNFAYNFGHTKVKQARQHRAGNEDEKQRSAAGDAQ